MAATTTSSPDVAQENQENEAGSAGWLRIGDPSVTPRALSSMGTAYDPVRQEIVVFGGRRANEPVADTWTWDGTSWTKHEPAESPPARYGAAMEYYPRLGGLVMFGGYHVDDQNQLHYLDDTWMWDGSSWRELSPSRSPSGRYFAAMAYDDVTESLLLFGGSNPTGSLADTWLFDGTTWSEVKLTVHPSPRWGAGMVPVPTHGGVLLYGGIHLNDTWMWNGETWNQLRPDHSPPATLFSGSLTYDEAKQEAVAFVHPPGLGDAETWTWTGDDWNRKEAVSPPLRWIKGVFEYFPPLQRVFMYGGGQQGLCCSDSWLWDGTSWSDVSLFPSPRLYSQAALDTARNRIVLFGGVDRSFLNDTWVYDGATWKALQTGATPPARAFATMAYDAERGEIVLFGGYGTDGRHLADTWVFDGSSWTQRFPATSPPAREAAAMAYDSVSKKIVLFGGGAYVGSTYRPQRLGDTWTWDGTTWSQEHAVGPSPRISAGIARDASGAPILFGGCCLNPVLGTGEGLQVFADTWRWRGNIGRWELVETAASPPPRYAGAMAYDPVSEVVVLQGGCAAPGPFCTSPQDGHGFVEETWVFDGEAWRELSVAQAPSPRWYPAAADGSGALAPTVIGGGGGGSGGDPDCLGLLGGCGDQWAFGSRSSATAGLSVSIDDAPDPATAGQSLVYSIRVTNEGPAASHAWTKIRLPWRRLFSPRPVTASQGTCQQWGVISCELGAIAPGQTVLIEVRASPSSEGTMTASADLYWSSHDLDISNNHATAETVVQSPCPPLYESAPDDAPNIGSGANVDSLDLLEGTIAGVAVRPTSGTVRMRMVVKNLQAELPVNATFANWIFRWTHEGSDYFARAQLRKEDPSWIYYSMGKVENGLYQASTHPVSGEFVEGVRGEILIDVPRGPAVGRLPQGEKLTKTFAETQLGLGARGIGTASAIDRAPSGESYGRSYTLGSDCGMVVPVVDPTPSPTLPEPENGLRGSYPVVPDDPYFGPGQDIRSVSALKIATQWGPQKIAANQAWQEEQATGFGIDVAVLDTGVDLDHEDLSCPGKLKVVAGSDVYSNDDQPDDDNSHGTHVAGIIAACTNNGTGIAGVAPDATIMPFRVLGPMGHHSEQRLISGIEKATAAGAEVINMSLGFQTEASTDLFDFSAVDAAIEAAAAQGVVLVAAAANDSFPLCNYPALAQDIICVGATDSRDLIASYSNFPNKMRGGPAVVAPGGSGQIFCDVHSENVLSLVPPGLDDCDEGLAGYAGYDGTSMATPHVAGVAALVYDRLGGQRSPRNGAKVIEALTSTAVDLGVPGDDPVYGSGRVDALAAVSAIEIAELAFSEDSATSAQHSDPAHVAARLANSKGAPIAGAEVSFILEDENGSRSFSATTDDGGLASSDIAITERPGTYTLTASYRGDERYAATSATTEFTVTPEDSVTALEVAGYGRERRLTATVTDQDAPDKGLSGVTVTFSSDGQAIGEAVTDEGGVATLAPPAPHHKGTHTYEASFAGNDFYLSSRDDAVTGEGVSRLGFTSASAVTGQYSDDVGLEVLLQDEGGDPIEGAEITFELTGPGGSATYEATSDANGLAHETITLEAVPGRYTLTARYAGLLGHHTSAAVSRSFDIAREDSALALEVSGNGSNRLLVATLSDGDAPAAGIAGRLVRFYADDNLLGSETTGADGRASFDPPPRYQGGRRTYRVVFEGDDFYLSSAKDKTT